MSEHLKENWRNYFNDRCSFLSLDKIEKSVNKLAEILNQFLNSGLADNNFIQGLNGKDFYVYRQRLAEMLLYDRLTREGFTLTSKDYGPDFVATKGEISLCIELTTPKPDKFISESNEDISSRLNPDPEKTRHHMNDCLLRFTCSLKAKKNQISKWRQKGIVKEGDIVLIIVNEANLWPEDICLVKYEEPLKGISNKPLIFEAVHGLKVNAWREENSELMVYEKFDERTKNRNEAPIELNAFLGVEWSEVSGVISINLREEYVVNLIMFGGGYDGSVIVHNKNADTPLEDDVLKTYCSYLD